jgi:SulP family sulfate permease
MLCTDHTKVVVLDAETSPFVDVSAAAMLVELETNLARKSIDFRIARDVARSETP